MASTNKTTHYDLSQYIGTDKPTYLVDYNQDMSRIDTGIYGAYSKASLNETNIGVLTNLTTTTQSDVVSAVNEVNGNIGDLSDLTTTAKNNSVAALNEINTIATSALNIGNTANSKADTNASNITSLSGELTSFISYFSLTDTRLLQNPVITRGGGSITTNDLRIALNSDGTLGKIYGVLLLNGQTDYPKIKFINTGIMGVTSGFTIQCAGLASSNELSDNQKPGGINIRIEPPASGETSASIELSLGSYKNGGSSSAFLFPCLYFFTDFGDAPSL